MYLAKMVSSRIIIIIMLNLIPSCHQFTGSLVRPVALNLYLWRLRSDPWSSKILRHRLANHQCSHNFQVNFWPFVLKSLHYLTLIKFSISYCVLACAISVTLLSCSLIKMFVNLCSPLMFETSSSYSKSLNGLNAFQKGK